ncbi:MAG: dipeptidase [Woeseiaceae bacterium]|nr:dipeptidase [Woeseiaceae bacterium]
MKARILAAALAATALTACSQSSEEPTPDLAAEAQRIAQDAIIVDGHIDVPYRLQSNPDDVTQATEGGDFDHPRAVSGGLNAPFMSIYTPAGLGAEGGAYELANELIDSVEAIVATAPDKFAIATSPAEVRQQFSQGLISLPLGMENGAPIEGSLDNLRHFHERGIRYVSLAHSLANDLADSSYDVNRRWDGLSDLGIEVLHEMNRLGIMVDVSHLSDDAFWDVMEETAVPVIASHSSARRYTPGFERNMDDDMIVALAENGGVIMINYGSSFVTADANRYSMGRWAARTAFELEHRDLSAEEASERFEEIWAAEHGPYPYSDLSDVLDHFDHVIALVGVDYVGIGSDYDGVGDSLPTGLKDVSSYPNLVRGLLERGYSEDDIRKILGENLLRVWDEVEGHAAAANQAATTSSST